MTAVYSKALKRFITVNRLVGHLAGKKPGPTVIFLGGVHGNEPAGILALNRVMAELEGKEEFISGNVFAVSGNISALEKGERFSRQDLNRMWTREKVRRLKTIEEQGLEDEEAEQYEINKFLRALMKENTGPYYYFDIHTTSSNTIPFITVNDSLLNRRFTTRYPVPKIMGIEEYLDGPILSYINEVGYIAFGFEAGQHDDPAAVDNAVSFAYLSMCYTGTLGVDDFDIASHHDHLAGTSSDLGDVYEIFYRHEVVQGENFKMLPGFTNFQKIRRGQILARSKEKTIKSKSNARIFMPLYQDQGQDGFFTIRAVWPVFLRLSSSVRKWKLDRILPWLPGVHWASEKREAMIIDRRVAFFLVKPLMHLLGYRSKVKDATHWIVRNREAASRHEEYQKEDWYRNKIRPH